MISTYLFVAYITGIATFVVSILLRDVHITPNAMLIGIVCVLIIWIVTLWAVAAAFHRAER